MRTLFAALFVLAAFILGAGVTRADAPASGIGCETISWGFLGSQRRTICDGPKGDDGGWLRARIIWTPAHYVPFTCYGGWYVSSCYGGYFVDESQQARETYLVYDYNVLPDEPDWLPPGTDNVLQ